jgi:hypothetical protein
MGRTFVYRESLNNVKDANGMDHGSDGKFMSGSDSGTSVSQSFADQEIFRRDEERWSKLKDGYAILPERFRK